MDTPISEEEQALREQVERSERELEALEEELRATDAERDQFAGKTRQYELLATVCDSLEELDSLGAEHLFWDGPGTADDGAEQLRGARRRLEAFQAQIGEIRERRESIAARIGEQHETLDVLHYDLNDAIEQEESRRQNEWLIEREVDCLPSLAAVMPWARGCEEDQRFRRSLAASIIASIAAGLLVSIVELPIPERETVIEVPERVARLVREVKLPPPPPPVEVVEEPPVPEEDLPEPEPELAEEQPPEPTETAEEPVVAQTPKPEPKEQVQSKGILAFRESFASRANLKPTPRLGSQARIGNAGEKAVGRPERSMVTTSAPGSSGGINLGDISRDVGGGGGGGAITGVQVTRVASSIGGAEGPDRPLSAGVAAGRTDEEIQIVFDRYKAALYRLYNRELRKDPTLRGQLVLRLTIEPDGSVSFVEVKTSDMGAPLLAEQVVGRVRNFDFGAKEGIVAMTIIYPIDFLPAA